MDVKAEDKALRTHPVPPALLLHAMKAIIEENREQTFLNDFANAFVLASEEDIAHLKSFLARHGDSNSPSVKAVVGAYQC